MHHTEYQKDFDFDFASAQSDNLINHDVLDNLGVLCNLTFGAVVRECIQNDKI